jgi:hypothetical protein
MQSLDSLVLKHGELNKVPERALIRAGYSRRIEFGRIWGFTATLEQLNGTTIEDALEKERQRMDSFYQILSNMIVQKMFKGYQNDKWALQKALEYLSLTQNHPHKTTFETVLSVFEVYRRASVQGKKVSAEFIGDIVRVDTSTVYRILRTVGLEALVRTLPRLSKDQKKSVLNMWDTKLPASDIAYFANQYFGTDFDRATFNNILDKMGKRRGIYRLGMRSWDTKISYRLASQVYESIDAGFNLHDTMEYTGATEDQVNAAIKIEGIAKPRIIRAIKLLTGQHIKTPYLGSLRYAA